MMASSPSSIGLDDGSASNNSAKRQQRISEMKRPTPKKTTKARPWTKEDVQALKTMVREKTKTTVIARKLKRTPSATRQKAGALGVKADKEQRSREKGIRLVADHYPARPGSGLRSIRPVWIAILSVTQLVYACWRLRRAGTGA